MQRAAGRHRAGRSPAASSATATGGLVVASASWGLATSGTKYALAGVAPVTLLATQLAAATAVLWSVLVVRDRRRGAGWRPQRWSARQWRVPLVLGLLEPALAYLAVTLGLARTSAANASMIIGLETTFVVLLAALVLHERITPHLGIAVAVGLVGLVVLEQVSWLSGPGAGDLLVLLGALSAAGYTIVARFAGPGGDALALTARQFTVGLAGVTPLAVGGWCSGSEPVPTHVAPRFWAAAALVGILGFGISFLIYNQAVAVVSAGTSAVIINLIPAFGLVSAVAWLGEDLTPARLAGAALITASVALFTRVELRRPATQPTPEPLVAPAS